MNIKCFDEIKKNVLQYFNIILKVKIQTKIFDP